MSYAFFLCLSQNFCVWLHLFPYSDIHACSIAECYTGSVYKLATCVFLVFSWWYSSILSHDYICNTSEKEIILQPRSLSGLLTGIARWRLDTIHHYQHPKVLYSFTRLPFWNSLSPSMLLFRIWWTEFCRAYEVSCVILMIYWEWWRWSKPFQAVGGALVVNYYTCIVGQLVPL